MKEIDAPNAPGRPRAFRGPARHRPVLDDLYQLVRIEPQRIEFADEARGWGFRETADL